LRLGMIDLGGSIQHAAYASREILLVIDTHLPV